MLVAENSVFYLEMVTHDVDGVRELYAQSYGWQFEPKVVELGNAYVVHLPEGSLFAIRAPMSEAETPKMRTYLHVQDIDAAVKSAARLGANILLERMEIAGYGIIAIYEKGGIEHGLWQVQ